MILLLLCILTIMPVSNEQIQKNMGFSRDNIEYVLQYTPFESPRRAPWRLETYTVYGNDGTIFVIKYYTLAFTIGVNIIDDGGLDLNGWYLTTDDLINAINTKLQEYNQSLPIGDPICLLPLGSLYLLKQRKNVRTNKRYC